MAKQPDLEQRILSIARGDRGWSHEDLDDPPAICVVRQLRRHYERHVALTGRAWWDTSPSARRERRLDGPPPPLNGPAPTLDEIIHRAIAARVDDTGTRRRAAESLHISERTIYRHLKAPRPHSRLKKKEKTA